MFGVSLLVAATLQPLAYPVHSTPINGRFEEVDATGVPTGWDIVPVSPNPGFEMGITTDENGGRVARIVRVASPPQWAPYFGSFGQAVDAAPYRGRLVRLSARVRALRPGQHIGLGLRVMRPAPHSMGFYDPMRERPITANEWRTYEIVGRVAPDATVLSYTVTATGDAELLVDDVVVEAVEPDPAPPSPEAAAFLDRAINLLREHHIDTRDADWDRITANARAEIGGARGPADTYAAIRGILGELGDRHTFLRVPDVAPPPPPASSGGAGTGTRRAPMPRFKLVNGRFGVVRLPAHAGSEEESRLYATTLRTALQALDRHGVCGWVVDLRGNSGGNMWPMLSGLDPLLGAAPFGSFITASGEIQNWVRASGEIQPAAASDREAPYLRLRGSALPVAVLIDTATASAGEMTATSLIGRAGVRSFGHPSNGLITGTSSHDLGQGASLIIASARVRDRTGQVYREKLLPDEPAADAEAAALRWLAGQPCQLQ